MRELIKNANVLCAITLVAGLLLGAVFEITEKPREEQKRLAKENAYKEVMKDAAEFEELELKDNAAETIKKSLEENDITEKNVVVDECVRAFDAKKKFIGYVITVTSKEGYGGNITFSVGISDGGVSGVSILSISETAGLGMNAKDESFLSQYEAGGEGMFIVNKADGAEGTNIDAISGATITTKAMTKGVNAAMLTADCLDELYGTKKDPADESGSAENGTNDGDSAENGTDDGDNAENGTDGGESAENGTDGGDNAENGTDSSAQEGGEADE